MSEEKSIENTNDESLLKMLEEVTNTSPKGVILSKDLFEKVNDESLIYQLGHFTIQVKNVLPPFCPLYLHSQLATGSYILCSTLREVDEKLLDLNYNLRKEI